MAKGPYACHCDFPAEGKMKIRGVIALVLVLFTVCGPRSKAMAGSILYTIAFVASGTVGD